MQMPNVFSTSQLQIHYGDTRVESNIVSFQSFVQMKSNVVVGLGVQEGIFHSFLLIMVRMGWRNQLFQPVSLTEGGV